MAAGVLLYLQREKEQRMGEAMRAWRVGSCTEVPQGAFCTLHFFLNSKALLADFADVRAYI